MLLKHSFICFASNSYAQEILHFVVVYSASSTFLLITCGKHQENLFRNLPKSAVFRGLATFHSTFSTSTGKCGNPSQSPSAFCQALRSAPYPQQRPSPQKAIRLPHPCKRGSVSCGEFTSFGMTCIIMHRYLPKSACFSTHYQRPQNLAVLRVLGLIHRFHSPYYYYGIYNTAISVYLWGVQPGRNHAR